RSMGVSAGMRWRRLACDDSPTSPLALRHAGLKRKNRVACLLSAGLRPPVVRSQHVGRSVRPHVDVGCCRNGDALPQRKCGAATPTRCRNGEHTGGAPMTSRMGRCAAAFAAGILALTGFAISIDGVDAQSGRTVRIVVPYTPGSGPDILSRLVAEQV